MKNLSALKMGCLAAAFCFAAAIPSPAQTFKTLVNFNTTNGANPFAGLVQGTDGYFYGTTAYGGTNYTCSALPRSSCGTVFKMTPAGTLTTLSSLGAVSGGYDPQAPLVHAANGGFYGTTMQGGALSLGTIFKITSGGTLTLLYTYNNKVDGAYPDAALVQAPGGDLYGTTRNGGANGDGTVFKISGGTLTVLHSFNNTDGSLPYGLVLATDGDFYGVTNEGGATFHGTIFKITAAGTLTTLYSFCPQTNCSDGASPYATLVQGNDGDFYGTTGQGGAYGDGTVFKMTPAGVVTTLHSFSGADGMGPFAGLVQGTDGNFYGTTQYGGFSSYGTIYKITPAGALTTLHNFHLQDGSVPDGTLLQATNGIFYGTTEFGGAYGTGTVFSLDVGLRLDTADGAPKQ
jgi:uncharacterized repeat protein (TIGR03803 family)